jgi:DNA-binding MarR family transcriptional regulator
VTDQTDPLLLAQTLRLNVDRLRRLVRAAGTVGDLTRPQESALSILRRHGPLATADLARRESLRPQSMGAVVGELLALGLVGKDPDPADGRREFVSLTPAGRDAVAAVSRARDVDLAALLSEQLDERQRGTLAESFAILESLRIGTP